MPVESILGFGMQTLAAGTPLLLAALGEVFAERAGVLNVGLEGLLLLGAFGAVMAAVVTGSAGFGLLAGIGAGLVGALVFALFGVGLRRDQVIVGTALNFLALGLTGVLYRAWAGPGTGVKIAPTLPYVWGEGGTSVNALTLCALALVPVGHWLLFRTRLGVTLRAAGEAPQAVEAAGTALGRLRVLVLVASGALCGAGGAALAIGYNNAFTENMTGGRGFVALAVVVLGRWSPWGALAAALLFAGADVAQARLQTLGWGAIPYPVFLGLPYALTLFALALRGARVYAPAALGQPHERT